MSILTVIMQVAAVQFSAQRLFQSARSDLKQSLTADPAEAAKLRISSRKQAVIAAKLLRVADENDQHVLDMVA
ncbi:MAG: hypothetical protein QGF56_01545 [Verrucomicrobiota bacterium]|nr:hypothetical protein [Verrucomicrobiota bacterium]MDP6752343.1 hypothetical protein [Verrucomicrobiota bacterium]MDP7013780.1 hypothetical protein [Verrucomicrobiota bacterium]